MTEIVICGKKIGLSQPTFFVADIAANHDNDLGRAKELIYLCAEAGADAAKFQHFKADTIVSDYGFRELGSQKSHQSRWKKSVFDVYKDASLNIEWTQSLKETCDKVGIAFMTSPYSLEIVDQVYPYVSAYKIGSGDITWLELINYLAAKGKPILLASGASNFNEVCCAMEVLLNTTRDVVLMQCNTNYTASLENFKYINLNVLKCYQYMYPDVIVGLSDHTTGHATVLGAVALGARVIEKHFTDDTSREGPDHLFSMDPISWEDMVLRTRELELALGVGIKKVEDNETETVILQRRAIRARIALQEGMVVTRDNLEFLRPCPKEALTPADVETVIGRKIRKDITAGEHLCLSDLM